MKQKSCYLVPALALSPKWDTHDESKIAHGDPGSKEKLWIC